jgi:hypothetical protein
LAPEAQGHAQTVADIRVQSGLPLL